MIKKLVNLREDQVEFLYKLPAQASTIIREAIDDYIEKKKKETALNVSLSPSKFTKGGSNGRGTNFITFTGTGANTRITKS